MVRDDKVSNETSLQTSIQFYETMTLAFTSNGSLQGFYSVLLFLASLLTSCLGRMYLCMGKLEMCNFHIGADEDSSLLGYDTVSW